jgi:hypothetical protein
VFPAHIHLQDPPEGYEYTILPIHPIMKNIVITADTKFGNRKEIAQPEEFERHTYPFKGLKIRSHLRPHFALFQAGVVLDSNLGDIVNEVARTYFPEIDKIYKIHRAWQQNPPAGYKKQKEFKHRAANKRPGDDSDSETGSKVTRRQRLNLSEHRYAVRSKGPLPQETGNAGGSKVNQSDPFLD